jgi:hypothetical protein
MLIHSIKKNRICRNCIIIAYIYEIQETLKDRHDRQ